MNLGNQPHVPKLERREKKSMETRKHNSRKVKITLDNKTHEQISEFKTVGYLISENRGV